MKKISLFIDFKFFGSRTLPQKQCENECACDEKKSEFAFALCAHTHSDFLVTPPGFEPRLAGPKPDVLPLHNGAIL